MTVAVDCCLPGPLPNASGCTLSGRRSLSQGTSYKIVSENGRLVYDHPELHRRIATYSVVIIEKVSSGPVVDDPVLGIESFLTDHERIRAEHDAGEWKSKELVVEQHDGVGDAVEVHDASDVGWSWMGVEIERVTAGSAPEIVEPAAPLQCVIAIASIGVILVVTSREEVVIGKTIQVVDAASALDVVRSGVSDDGLRLHCYRSRYWSRYRLRQLSE